MSGFDKDLWGRLEPLLDKLLAVEPGERAALLDDPAVVDPELKPHLESLLDATEETGSPLDQDVVSWGAPLYAGDEPVESADGTPAHVDRYRILQLLGRGGMGSVHLAERDDGSYRQRVALKILRRGLDTDEILARFRRERQILAGLDHPGIARLLDGGATGDGRPYLVMELVEGVPVTEFAATRSLSAAACVDLLIQACDAVGYAQRRLVVHRDLKPANILVTTDGTVKLLDFGVAKLLTGETEGLDAEELRTLTGEGRRLLTPAYAAPEQLAGEPVTTATDVHALGILLHEVLTGVHPRDKDRAQRPLDGDLATIVAMATREEPDLRYASAVELADDLRRFRAGDAVVARPATIGYRVRKFVRKRRAEIAVTAAIFALLVAGLAGTTWQARRAEREATAAGEITAFLVELFDAADPDAVGGEDPTARDLLRVGAERIRESLSDDAETRARLLAVLGDLHIKLGEYEAARPLLAETLEIRRAQGDRAGIRSGLFRLGTVEIHLAAYDAADSLMAEALAMYEGTEPTPEYANFLSDLAVLKSDRGEFGPGQEFYLRSLAMHEQLYGADDLRTIEVLSNYGVHLIENKQVDDAVEKARLVATARRAQLPDDHSQVAVALHNLAFALAAQDSLAEAERTYLESVAIRRKIYPGGHPDLAHSLRQMAQVVQKQGRLDEAEEMLVESAEMNARFFSEPRVATAMTWNDMAIIAYRRADYLRAADGFREALVVFEDLLPGTHGILLQVENNLAGSLRRGGELGEAARHYVNIYERRARRGDMTDPLSPRDVLDAGWTFRRTGDPERAVPLLREAYERRLANEEISALNLADARSELGLALMAVGRRGEARELLEAALPVLEAELEADDERLTEAQAALARLGGSLPAE